MTLKLMHSMYLNVFDTQLIMKKMFKVVKIA